MSAKRFFIVSISIMLFTVLIYVACGKKAPVDDGPPPPPPPPTRIVSFAPNITEILYALGLGDKVVGVTRFCSYPPEAAQKEKIGGHTDRNYEMIVRLQPDLAVILKEDRESVPFLLRYGIRYATVGSGSVDDIIESIQTVAEACAVPESGDSLVLAIRSQLSERVGIDRKLALLPESGEAAYDHPDELAETNRPKVLICVGRDDIGSGAVGKCFAAGASSFYNALIDLAGGTNVMSDVYQAYPSISAEAILRLDPDVIIDLSANAAEGDPPQRPVCGDWQAFKTVSAVKNKRVRCPTGDYLTVPGPRFMLIVDEFQKLFK
jgi:iron complex transport system substrate-binding protein